MVHFFGILSNIIYGLLFRQIKLYNVCANLESSLCSILSMLVRAKKFNVQKKWVQSHTQKQLAINYTIFFDTVDFSSFQEAKPISKLIFFSLNILILPLHFGFSDSYAIKLRAVDQSAIQFWTLLATDHSTYIIITFLLKYVNNSYRGENCKIGYCLLY